MVIQNAERQPKRTAYPGVMQYAYHVRMEKENPRMERRRHWLSVLIDENGGQAEVARAIGSPKSYLSAIQNGGRGLGDKLAARIEEAYGKPAGWLDQPVEAPNVVAGPAVQGLVPLISFVQAGEWCDMVDSLQPGDAFDWLPCPVRHGRGTFCLEVEGESMYDPSARHSYRSGDIIFVDPTKDAQHGDRVVVRLDDQQKATFKQLIEEDGRRMLKAINPDWKPRYMEINGNASICGVVIGKWVKE